MAMQFPRLVRATEEPLGLYLRPAHNDHQVLCQLLSEGRSSMSGVVFDPGFADVHEELRSAVRERKLWAVLDPRIMELGTPGGFTPRLAALPWGGDRYHTPNDLVGANGERVVDEIVKCVVRNGYTAVLAPSHFLADGAVDPWMRVDHALTCRLRERLDQADGSDVAIYYPLATTTKVFMDGNRRAAVMKTLADLPIESIWLRIHPFGSHSGHVTLARYMSACRDLHKLKIPLIAEKTGNIGLALLAFGAVGGTEAGVSSGERFDYGRLSRIPKKSKGFSPQARVYIPGLGLFLERAIARSFFEHRNLKANFACANNTCCRRGASDTLTNPRRHFVYTRMDEVGLIGSVPLSLRASEYLEKILRPATDRLGRAMQTELPDSLRSKLESTRKKLDGWRDTLGQMSRWSPALTSSPVPERLINKLRRGA